MREEVSTEVYKTLTTSWRAKERGSTCVLTNTYTVHVECRRPKSQPYVEEIRQQFHGPALSAVACSLSEHDVTGFRHFFFQPFLVALRR